MAGTSTPALAAEVSNAGALGSIAVGAVDAAAARAMIDDLKQRTQGPFNVNVFVHRPARADKVCEQAWLKSLAPLFRTFDAEPPAQLREIYRSFCDDPLMADMLAQTRPAVASFHFGLPSKEVIARLKACGIALLSTATNLREAMEAERAGIDAVVAQGFEAGGHRGVFDPGAPDSQLAVAALTRLLVRRLAIPVIAAGAIMDGAGIAAMLALGAEAAQLGTAFIGCPESGADAHYRAALFGQGATATEMTAIISGRPARSLPNRFTQLQADTLKALAPPDYPIAYDAAKALDAAARAKGEGGFAAQWAGQGAPLARALPAATLVGILAEELLAARARQA
jgi:nitronate monooxygenase